MRNLLAIIAAEIRHWRYVLFTKPALRRKNLRLRLELEQLRHMSSVRCSACGAMRPWDRPHVHERPDYVIDDDIGF